jgi:hypothetical protein
MHGIIEKMHTQFEQPVRYSLVLAAKPIELNSLIGLKIQFNFSGRIFCLHCQQAIKKTFNQGYCYRCFVRLAACDSCMIKPETCHYGQGTCREPTWAQSFCFQAHSVYLANSSGLKVGITRQTQIPTRWLDQGATQALAILRASNRHISGLAEVILARHVSDKTQWQQMLKRSAPTLDLAAEARQLLQSCESELNQLRQTFGATSLVELTEAAVTIEFPIQHYPTQIKSLNFDKTAEISGVLLGIKGQYLILDSGVLNLRKFGGYEITLIVI